MAKGTRIERTLPELLHALDQQLYLLRNSYHGLREDQARLRTLATVLRTLVCLSSGTEGLLWRLIKELQVSDELELQCAGRINRGAPPVFQPAIASIPLCRPGLGPPWFRSEIYRLHDVIKNHEAIFVAAVQDVVYTHEMLINAVAGQIGAHEAEGLDHRLVKLNGFLVNNAPLYFSALAFDAELTMQVCERVLDFAERAGKYQRMRRGAEQGDFTLVLRFSLRQQIAGRVPLMTFRSSIGECEIDVAAGPRSIVFSISKRAEKLVEIPLPYPPDWGTGEDEVFAFCYSSNHRKVRTMTTRGTVRAPSTCDFGWIDAREVAVTQQHDVTADFVTIGFAATYPRLLPPIECAKLRDLSLDMRDYEPRTRCADVFPD